jgi:glucokinase
MNTGTGNRARTLVADIGGTNVRFGLAAYDGGQLQVGHIERYRCAEFASGDAAISHYLAQLPPELRPRWAAIAVAGPVTDGAIRFTNLSWSLSEHGLAETHGFEAARLLNDYAALGLAVPSIDAAHLHRLGPATTAAPTGTVAVLGPGTGFGVTAVIRDRGSEAVLSSEGGHAGFAPDDEVEMDIWRRLHTRYGRVSIERLLSGPGLLNLYEALCEIRDVPVHIRDSEDVARAADRQDPVCVEALLRFCAILGSAAGDIALTLGATGGVYIAGGMAPRLLGWLERSEFRIRFEAKGRLSPMVQRIPTQVITHPHPALLGAAAAIRPAMSPDNS